MSLTAAHEEELLAAAERAFAAHGYRTFDSFDLTPDVAELFASREAVFKACLDRVVVDACWTLGGADPSLRSAIGALFDFAAARPEAWALTRDRACADGGPFVVYVERLRMWGTRGLAKLLPADTAAESQRRAARLLPSLERMVTWSIEHLDIPRRVLVEGLVRLARSSGEVPDPDPVAGRP